MTTTNTVEFAEWLRTRGLSLNTVDPADDLDDLEPVRELIGDARVVAIGESSHHVREFYLLRHRLLRFLVERCGFTVLAFEAPTVGADAIDAWVGDGEWPVAEVAAGGSMAGLLECDEMYGVLGWMRAHNRAAAERLRWAGVVPGGGSPLPELEAAMRYLRSADAEAVPLLEQAIEGARVFHNAEVFTALTGYAALSPADQDALTAAVSRLLFRTETMAASVRGTGLEQAHAVGLRHLRSAWRLDHFHRDVTGRGLAVGSSSLDACMAQTVLDLVEDAPGARVVLALHNVHIRKAAHAGAAGLFPAGYHLAQALGDDYRTIAVTGVDGRTGRVRPAPGSTPGFEVSDVPLPALTEHSIESAFHDRAAVTIADLRAARSSIHDAHLFQQSRMEDYYMDVPVFDSFDAIATIPHTTCTDYPAANTAPAV